MSILSDTKEDVGAPPGEDFDNVILRYINSTCLELAQLGATGPHLITVTPTSKWEDYDINADIIAPVQELVSAKVQLKFDTPSSEALVQALKDRIQELEYRIKDQMELVNGT